MGLSKNASSTWNFTFRDRPQGWVDDPVTVTDEAGNTYQLVALTDADGNVTSPVSGEDIFQAVNRTNDLLEEVVFLLKAIAES